MPTVERQNFPKINRFFHAICSFFFRFLYYAVFLLFSCSLYAKMGVYLLTDTLPFAILVYKGSYGNNCPDNEVVAHYPQWYKYTMFWGRCPV